MAANRVDQSVFVRRGGEKPPAYHVLTPGGYRHVSMVHEVPPGHYLRQRKGRLQIVERATRRIRKRVEMPLEDATIPGLGSGWMTYAYWAVQETISQLTTQWVVPPEPAVAAGQTVFLFNGLEDSQNSILLQPVLQWGTSHAGGGNSWAIANWFIDPSGQAYFTQLRPVFSGDVLTGVVEMSSFDGTSYGYTSYFEGHNDIQLTVRNLGALTWAAEVLEAYQIAGANDYPGVPSTMMSSIGVTLQQGVAGANWQIVDAMSVCGEHTNVPINANPGGEVEISYI